MIEYGLVGERLGHSHSPEIHGKIAPYKYELIEIPKENVGEFFAKREFSGVNVTIPYKETVIPYLDDVHDTARKIGAVNTVVNRGGKLYGYNTDFFGMSAAMTREGIDPKGKKVLILGSGGTSKTAWYAAETLGAKEIVKVSRTGRNGAVTYEKAYSAHSDAKIIINTTPCGMFPNVDASPVDISRFPELEGVFDAIFNPLRTKLVESAKERGIKTCGGLYMLVSQAVRASEFFTGNEYPKGLAESIYSELFMKEENVVLIGMPSSGKTTVGKLVAERLGRDFVDTDDMIAEAEGRTIPEIFASDGEEYFRAVESRAVAEAAKLQSAVIATGGGAILRPCNVSNLKLNGKLYFLNRDLEKLVSTADRPLSSDRATLEKRYDERIAIYNGVCDAVIDSNGSAEAAARQILSDRGIK